MLWDGTKYTWDSPALEGMRTGIALGQAYNEAAMMPLQMKAMQLRNQETIAAIAEHAFKLKLAGEQQSEWMRNDLPEINKFYQEHPTLESQQNAELPSNLKTERGQKWREGLSNWHSQSAWMKAQQEEAKAKAKYDETKKKDNAKVFEDAAKYGVDIQATLDANGEPTIATRVLIANESKRRKDIAEKFQSERTEAYVGFMKRYEKAQVKMSVADKNRIEVLTRQLLDKEKMRDTQAALKEPTTQLDSEIFVLAKQREDILQKYEQQEQPGAVSSPGGIGTNRVRVLNIKPKQ